MARTTYIIKCQDACAAIQTAEKILREEKYDYIQENGQSVWKNGNAAWAAVRYIRLIPVDHATLHIEGWVKGTVGGEMNLDGIFGGLPKKMAAKVIQRIRAAIEG